MILTGKELTKMLINDRYELREEIRRGGFGVTWYAWDTNLDMPVAIKEFSDPDPEHRRKFIREARSLAKVSGSRGIVNVRDYLEFDGRAYMVMEYLDGEDLSACIDRTGRLSLDETWQLLLPVMSVLTKLHKADMIHRDVSPDNIRITGDGEVKLLDFGSVSNLTSEHLTRTVTVKPGYAPIEQYSGAAEQGPWTDEYSLCATIYKCITGRKPVDSLVRSFHDELERPSALGVKISREEEEVLMKGLSVNPRERYGSIDDLVNAMESAGSRSQHSSSVRSSVEDLAEDMNLSRVQLYRKVKAVTGSSPVELLHYAACTEPKYCTVCAVPKCRAAGSTARGTCAGRTEPEQRAARAAGAARTSSTADRSVRPEAAQEKEQIHHPLHTGRGAGSWRRRVCDFLGRQRKRRQRRGRRRASDPDHNGFSRGHRVQIRGKLCLCKRYNYQ